MEEKEAVNVKDYGATGGGVTDDSVAISCAVEGVTGCVIKDCIFEGGHAEVCVERRDGQPIKIEDCEFK